MAITLLSKNFMKTFFEGPNLLRKSANILSAQCMKYVSLAEPSLNKAEYEVTFIRSNGDRIKGKGKEGDSLLDVVVNNDLDIDGFGACEGTLTCSTCHVILKPDDFERLPSKSCDEENDMLDLAFGLTPTSRLGCQIQLTKALDGLEVQLPDTINDARS